VKCAVASCTADRITSCTWKSFTVGEDGKRIYAGDTCGLGLCAAHAWGARQLCRWHYERTNREEAL
jgi:hypothetical protein